MKRHKYFFPKYYIKVYRNYFNKILFSYLKNNVSMNNHIRQKVFLNIMLINNKYNLNKLQTFCIFTGRIKFTLTKFKVSRMIFKKQMSSGFYSGIYKAS